MVESRCFDSSFVWFDLQPVWQHKMHCFLWVYGLFGMTTYDKWLLNPLCWNKLLTHLGIVCC